MGITNVPVSKKKRIFDQLSVIKVNSSNIPSSKLGLSIFGKSLDIAN